MRPMNILIRWKKYEKWRCVEHKINIKTSINNYLNNYKLLTESSAPKLKFMKNTKLRWVEELEVLKKFSLQLAITDSTNSDIK